ncbi:MAG: hypothetical protein GC205_11775 [Bacteroidetes bacterium]|nr:hypothetical protein [Bacteroidota bacterium]
MESFFTNVVLPAGIYLIPVALIMMVVGMLWGMASNPKSAVKSIAGILAMVAIFLVAYAMSNSTNYSDMPASDGTVKAVQAGLITFTVLLVITVVAMIGSAIKDLLK